MNPLFERRGWAALTTKAESINTEARTIEAVVSTNSIDRDGEIVEPKAFEERIATFKRNPVVLWNHDPFQPPIGKVTDLQIGASKMEAKIAFRPAGESEIADNVFLAFKGGFLTSFSIGFRAFKVEETKDGAGKPLPLKIVDAELFEISAVTIPANTDAIGKHVKMLSVLQAKGWQQGDTLTLYSAPTDLDVIRRCAQIAKRDRKNLRADELSALQELQLAVMCSTASAEHEKKAVEDLAQVLAGLRGN
jgi:HK97 family phage prohead protease